MFLYLYLYDTFYVIRHVFSLTWFKNTKTNQYTISKCKYSANYFFLFAQIKQIVQ